MDFRRYAADVVVRKQAVWGSSFGWKSATTWRAVWPTSYARNHSSEANKVTKTPTHSNIYPAFDICTFRKQPTFLRSCSPSTPPDPVVTPPLRAHTIAQTLRTTDVELHAEVFRLSGKQLARKSKTHLQLHTDVFQDGVVWTPSGYVQDISSLITKRRGDTPGQESQRHPSQGTSTPLPSRSRSRTITARSLDKVVFPLG